MSPPGAGVRPYRGLIDLAEKGVITLQVGIHGIPVNLDPVVYDSLARAGLSGYPTFNLDDRDRYYYRRVYPGRGRAGDFLARPPKFYGKKPPGTGGSPGGAPPTLTPPPPPPGAGPPPGYPPPPGPT